MSMVVPALDLNEVTVRKQQYCDQENSMWETLLADRTGCLC